jgi:hypothetical protein
MDNKFDIDIFDIIRDDLYLILDNTNGVSDQTVALFDDTNYPSTTSTGTLYTCTIPVASFPLVQPIFFITSAGTFTHTSNIANPANLPAIFTSLGAPTLTYTSSGGNAIYTLTSQTSSVVPTQISAGGADYPFVASSYSYANGFSIQLVNMNYFQFVSGLNMLGAYYFEDLAIYAQNSLQAISPFTLTKYIDLFGRSYTEQVVPVLNPFAQQPACENVRINMPMDGNNVITYSVKQGNRVVMKITARAYDVLKGLNPDINRMPPYIVGNGGEPIEETLPPYYYDTLNKDFPLNKISNQ